MKTQLLSEATNFNFVTANGNQFQHPLMHLGKSLEDLPVIAIDSFKHMYVFPKYEDIHKPGNILERRERERERKRDRERKCKSEVF